MALYRDVVFPRLMNRAMDNATTRETRDRVCRGLAGEVLELGFGSGLNLPHLPATVTTLHAVDPSAGAARLAAGRVRQSRVRVVHAGLDGQSLPFDDASLDAALSTWTLCTIPDAVKALREVSRVLRPGGTLHFVEHGRAPDEDVRRSQDRWNALHTRVACGCRLNRDIARIIVDAGFRLDRMQRYYSAGGPRTLGATYEGVASPA
jgi:ubiquinone/menaquinone biosynthesis C-methylase UbiE